MTEPMRPDPIDPAGTAAARDGSRHGAAPPPKPVPAEPADADGAEDGAGLSRIRGLWNGFKLAGFALENLAYMMLQARIAPYLWWLRRAGRAAEADAVAYRMTLVWAERIFRRLGCRIEVEGAGHLRRAGPLVVMSNHQAMYDIPLLAGYLGRPVGFVFKRELLLIPVLKYWMRQIHCKAIDRKERRRTPELYERWGEEIRDLGRGMVVFPEGTRTRDPQGRFGSFRRGSLRLAERSGIPIQPVVFDGTRLLTDPAALARTPKGERIVRLKILPVRMPPQGSAPESKRFMDRLRADLAAEWERIRVTWG